jgi:hypothetical protein
MVKKSTKSLFLACCQGGKKNSKGKSELKIIITISERAPVLLFSLL